jgi:endonuclease/exonuclease/phosphatase family metal-dependent hydrolase
MGLQPTVTVFLAAKYLRTFGLVLLILPHFFGNDLPFGIIPQSVEKLVVMNSVGLPLLSYDFGYEERVLHSDLLVTSSLTAIVTYLTHSQILSTRLSSIKFEDRQLLFIIQEKLTFLIIVKKRTKIIDSALEVFTNAFIKVVPKDVADSGYLRPTFNQLIQDIRHSIIDQSFGSNYISSVEAEIQSQNQPDYGVFSMSRTIFSLVFAFSSLRLIYYIGSTLLIPEEGSLLLLLPALLYGSSIFIGPVLHQIFPITERRNFLLSLAIFFMIQLTTGPLITAVLIWSFALSSWNHLHTIWNSVFPRLSRQRRVHILILSLIMDMGLRAYNLGTDLSVSANTNPIFIIIAVTILLTFLAGFRDNSFDYPKEFAMGTKISFYVLAILIPINVRFTQNISQLLMFIDQPNILTYLSFGFVFLTILALSLQSKFLAWIRQHRSILIGFYFLPSVLIVSLEEMPTKRVHDFVKRNWSFLMIAVPSIMFLVIIFTYYGFSMLYIIPLTLIIAAVNLFTVYMDATPRRLANKSSYSMIICFLFLSSLLMPFTVPLDIEDHDLRFGVMSYNVQYGINANNEYDPVTISEFISHSGVDVVGLQEVTRNSIINGNGDLLLQFIQGLKLHGFDYYVFMEGSSEVFTNVIFSRHPIIQSSSIHFWNNEIFQKGMITARIQVGENIINIGNTHLTHVYSGTGNTTRRLQTEQVLDYFDMTEPSILLGDFNVEPDDTDIQLIKERFSDGYQGTRGTWPSLDPVMRIDYVFHSGITPTQVEVIDVSYSDHLPVIAWFDL